MQLRHALSACVVLAAAISTARADELTIRGNYYRDRNTRVLQPEASLSKAFSTGTSVSAHYLLDAITSASIAAGVLRDEPFTELRNEVGAGLAQRIGRGLLAASYSYSTESDYWAHLVSVSGAIDLFQKNTTLAVSFAYGHDNVGQRMGPTSFQVVGTLDTLSAIGSWTQVITKYLLGTLEYDLGVIGFGTRDNGYQANPYRVVNLGGAASHEKLPFQRLRQSAQATLHLIIPTHARITPYVAFRPSYRGYWDDWSVYGHTVELRTYVPFGPVEARVTGRYYTQSAASFVSVGPDGIPFYPGNAGLPCRQCLAEGSRQQEFLTSDPKLTAADTFFVDLRLLIALRGLRRLSPWLADGSIELSYGHLFNDRYLHTAYGDADLAGLQFTFPL